MAEQPPLPPRQADLTGHSLSPGAAPAEMAPSTASIERGVCKGRGVGDFACDGRDVVRCEDLGGAVTRVRICFSIERCDAAGGTCEPACPAGEVYIPPTGPDGYRMGRGLTSFGFGRLRAANRGSEIADAPHTVVLTRPFCMDSTEVTAAATLDCVEHRGCRPPSVLDRWATYSRKPDHPVNMVDWPTAKIFCERNQKSLPTEAQWEWAATGGDGRMWPWGDEQPTCERADYTKENTPSPGGDCGCHGGGTSPVGSHPAGDKVWPSGRLHDLAGNVWEWMLDSYLPFSGDDEEDPIHSDSAVANHVIRGGGWNRSHRGILAAFRGGAVLSYKVPGLGFRCVRNPVD